MNVTYYKIRNLEGKYSSGGTSPTFLKLGKIWTLPQLKSHLRLIQKYSHDFTIYKDCELVVFTETVVPANIKLNELISPLEQELVLKKLTGPK